MRVDRSAPNDSSPPLGDGIPGCAHLAIGGLMPSLKRLLQAVLVGLDHLLDHLAAHRAGLLAGQVAVVALLQGDAHLVGGLHLELVHGLTGTGDNQLVAAVTVARHNFCLSFSFCLGVGYCLGWNIRVYLVPRKRFYAPSGFPVFVIFPCIRDAGPNRLNQTPASD